MALIKRSLSAKLISSIIPRVCVRNHSSGVEEKDIKKSVFISQSKDIYTNLALEDWLYRNFDFSNHHLLMLWQNDPCVVIGRHQNPWLEANVSQLDNITENGVKLARRNSGGGTVYHDNGNLNLTFFTPKEHYNRRYNLEVMTRAVFRKYNIKIDINKREDLTVSGTAAKLGRPNAYHHCTLLVNANRVDLGQALLKQEVGIQTNATRSVRSKIKNLCEEDRSVTVSSLLKAVGWEYMRTPAFTIKDGGKIFANQQKGFQMVNPTERWFPGITKLRDTFTSWNWLYGKTPKFTVNRSFSIPENLLNPTENVSENLKVKMVVEGGYINEITLYVPPGFSTKGFSGEANVVTSLKGEKFSKEAWEKLENSLNELVDDKDKFVTECVRQIMTSF